MPSMTPEEARRLLKADSGSTHGPGTNCHTCNTVRQNAWEMTQQIAGLTWEYGVEYKYLTNRGAEWRLDPSEGWHKTYRAADRAARTSVQFRIVRRRVSPPEEVKP